MSRSILDYLVLAALEHNVEAPAEIRARITDPEVGWTELLDRPLADDELDSTLARLVSEGFVQVYAAAVGEPHLKPVPFDSAQHRDRDAVSFGLTPRGRAVQDAWASAREVE